MKKVNPMIWCDPIQHRIVGIALFGYYLALFKYQEIKYEDAIKMSEVDDAKKV